MRPTLTFVTTSSGPDLSVFLCGDVMTGRGVDQILPHPADPTLREPVVKDARTYVRLAEKENGPIPQPVDFSWPWGEAIAMLDEVAPAVRVINLETSITGDGDFAPGKGIHYRMHPDNVGCLTAIHPDVCTLANNHILDFGYRGLADTLQTLTSAGIPCAGAGLDAEQAERPAVVTVQDGRRVVIAAVGMGSSGIPGRWAATESSPGVAYLRDLSKRSAAEIAERVLAPKRQGDVAIVSVHWGSNWGYGIDSGQISFAHKLIDDGVDLVHGHSSHHPRPIEVYRGKLVLYGCGDTINDYEGIGGYQAYRDELRLLYFVSIDPDNGLLTTLRMAPMRARRIRLERASQEDAEWLRSTLEHHSRSFGIRVGCGADGVLTVHAT
jgi:poly-gamma-glutamate capsule biosynthesis protein CapA/YwtB (metallophosphatase superfamily)